MKRLYIIGILLGLCASEALIAQVSISPNPIVETGVAADDFEGVGHAFVTNESGSYMDITWTRTVIEQTEGWTSAVCDLTQCWFPHIDTQSFGLNSGAEGILDVHVYPDGIEGGAIIQVTVSKTTDSNVSDVALYYFNETVSGVAERLTNAIKVYPNPAQEYISFEDKSLDINRLEIFNVSGKLVKTISTNGSSQISIADLTNGNYILKMMDANSKIVSTNLLTKQ